MATTPPPSPTPSPSPAAKPPGRKPNGRPKWLVPGIIVFALIAGIVFFMLVLKPKEEKQTFETTTVTRADIVKSVAATGKVVPNFEVEIKAKGSGKILRMPYDVSDYVKQGALLVQLDPIDESRSVSQASASLSGVENRMDQTRLNLQVARQNLSTNLDRARADLRAAEVRQREAQAQRQRLEELVRNRYISQQEYETGITTAAQATAELENARVRLKELQTQEIALRAQAEDLDIAAAEARGQRVALATAQQRLEETKVYAPISGIITTRTGQVGQIVASGISNVGGGTAIMTLADMSRIFVLASVDESDVGQVREGQMVNITADAFPNEKFAGRVVQIAPKGVEVTNVVTFEVKIEVTGANKNLLKPLMTANTEILIDRKNNAVVIPAEAIMNVKGRTMVRVVQENGKPRPRPVQVGINNGTEAEIVSGLRPGDKIVLGDAKAAQSKWRKDQQQGGAGGNRGGGLTGGRGGRMMMRGIGGGGRR